MLLLKNGKYWDWQSNEIVDNNVEVDPGIGGMIRFLPHGADESKQKNHYSRIIDCSGMLITKSFGNAHHHVYSALARGMPPPHGEIRSFSDVLEQIWWPLDRSLNLEMIEASALFTALDCIKNGVTFVIDHHASPNAVAGALETVRSAFEKVGISHLLCYEISGRDGDKAAQNGLDETEDYLSKHRGLVGLHASFTVDEALMDRAIQLAGRFRTGIHLHVAEDPVDQRLTLEMTGERVANRLDRIGALELNGSILAHCLHLDKGERELIRNSDVYVVQNSESNMNNKVGTFHSKGLGPRIMLGTDGMHSDMLRSMKMAYLNSPASDSTGFQQICDRFRSIHRYLERCGIAGDEANNLVVLDYDSPTEMNRENALSHLIYGIESRHVDSVISKGKAVMVHREFTEIDEKPILEYAQKMGKQLWKKLRCHGPS